MTTTRRIVILGAAGRDFHDFIMRYRDDPASTVVAFTAAQIPGVGGRRFPASLAGPRYAPDGIPIEDEADLEALCRRHRVTDVVFAYSDVSHAHVMHLASRALACGADFLLLGPQATMLARHGAGHRGVGGAHRLRQVADRALARPSPARARPPRGGPASSDALRRPGPPGRAALRDPRPTWTRRSAPSRSARNTSPIWLSATWCSRASTTRDRDAGRSRGRRHRLGRRQQRLPVRAPRPASSWSSTRCRPDDATGYHPGEAVLRMADVAVVNKVDAAGAGAGGTRGRGDPERPTRRADRRAPLRRCGSTTRRASAAVACWWSKTVPPSPTAGMPWGAGWVAATAAGAACIIDPRRAAAPAHRRGVRPPSAHRPGAAGDRLHAEQLAALARRRSRGPAPTSWSPPRPSTSPPVSISTSR